MTGRSVPRLLWLLGTAALVAMAALVGLIIGPTDIDQGGVLAEAVNRLSPWSIESNLADSQKGIVWNIRLPRVALGLLVGASLATAGAAYQGVFRNPLADPYLLGVAAGGGLGATIAFVNGWGTGSGLFDGVQIAAFIGAAAAVAATWAVGVLGDTGRSATSLILAGVAIASFATAAQTFLQQRNAEDIRRIFTWFLGGLSTTGWEEPLQLLPVAIICILVLSVSGRILDVLAVGDDEASMLGLAPGKARLVLIVFATLLTASAVAVSGLIAFVGLIIPHTVRMIFGNSYRIVVPLSALAGAGFLVLCDLAARTLLSPAELPIGVVTAFFGAPFFIIILRTTSLR